MAAVKKQISDSLGQLYCWKKIAVGMIYSYTDHIVPHPCWNELFLILSSSQHTHAGNIPCLHSTVDGWLFWVKCEITELCCWYIYMSKNICEYRIVSGKLYGINTV